MYHPIKCASYKRKVSTNFTNWNKHLKFCKINILKKSVESMHNIKLFFQSSETIKNHDVHVTHELESYGLVFNRFKLNS